MTTAQVINRFEIEFERVSSGAAPGYTPTELSALLNIAQEETIVNRYTGNNPLQQSFEQTEKRVEDIANLVKYQTFTVFTANPNLPNSYSITLPDTTITNIPTDYSNVFWFLVYERALSSLTNCATNSPTRIKVKEVNHMELEDMLDDPFNCPKPDRWLFRNRTESRTVNLITDGTFSPVSYTIGYIRKPQPIDLNIPLNNAMPDINNELQREIITEAVYQGVKALADARLQVYKQDLASVE